MKLILGRIASALLTAGGWLLAGVRLVLDLIGYATAPDDVTVARTRLDQFFELVLSAPWWAVWGFAFVSTFWLIWVSWPRPAPIYQKQDSPGVAPSAHPQPAPEAMPTPSGPEAPGVRKEEIEVSEEVYNQLIWFCIDYLMPACEAQIDLQKQIIKAATTSPYVAMYAWRGAVDHFKSFGFWNSYEALSEGLSNSPMTLTSFSEVAEYVANIEKTYNTFWGQTHLLSREGNFDYKHEAATAPLWEEWRQKHNALVVEYEKIKRDSRFGPQLFRPVRESRLGGLISE